MYETPNTLFDILENGGWKNAHKITKENTSRQPIMVWNKGDGGRQNILYFIALWKKCRQIEPRR